MGIMKNPLLIILLIPLLISWKWPAHEAFMQEVYYNTDLRNKLNLDYLEQGSIAPDKDFHDNRKHHYPPSYNLTLLWLDRAETALNEKDYKNASYNFGVASHYVSDSFVTPHYISGEPYYLHDKFEAQVSALKTKCLRREFNLKQELERASENGKYWEAWLETKDKNIVQDEAEQSLDLIYQLALSTFNAYCNNKNTEFQRVYFTISKEIILYSSFMISVFIIFISRKFSKN